MTYHGQRFVGPGGTTLEAVLRQINASGVSLGIVGADETVGGGTAELSTQLGGAGSGALFASAYGVTGINDGTRDDAALMRNCYADAVSKGIKTIVMPAGVVWFNTYTTLGVYPYNYCVQSTVDDFTFICPTFDCVIFTSIPATTNPVTLLQINTPGGSAVTKRNRVIGIRFIHTLGAASNNCGAVLSAANTDDSHLSFLYAKGFGVPYGSIDVSSSFNGYMHNIEADSCNYGIGQSSSSTMVRTLMSNLWARNCLLDGIFVNGPNVMLNSVYAENNARAGININSFGSGIQLSNFHILGNAKAAGSIGVIAGQLDSYAPTGNIQISDGMIDGCETALSPRGLQNLCSFDRIKIYNSVYALWAIANGGRHNTDMVVRDVTVDTSSYGILMGDTAASTAERYLIARNLRMLNVSTPWWNTSSVVKQAWQCFPKWTGPRPTLAAGDAGLEFWDAVSGSALNKPIYWNGSVWVDGAGTSV